MSNKSQSNKSLDIDKITAQLGQSLEAKGESKSRSLPPVHLWNPKLNGDLDMRIAADGRWFYQGDEIRRTSLAKLFASILKREEDDYFLVTPVEKWRIQIDLEAFCLNQFELVHDDNQENRPGIRFFNEIEESVELGPNNKIYFINQGGQQIPCIAVRDGLNASLSRAVFYQLIELGEEEAGELIIYSGAEKYSLGSLE